MEENMIALFIYCFYYQMHSTVLIYSNSPVPCLSLFSSLLFPPLQERVPVPAVPVGLITTVQEVPLRVHVGGIPILQEALVPPPLLPVYVIPITMAL